MQKSKQSDSNHEEFTIFWCVDEDTYQGPQFAKGKLRSFMTDISLAKTQTFVSKALVHLVVNLQSSKTYINT